MQYIYIILFAIAFSGGFATSNFISKREITDLKLNIEKSNLKASELLQQETKKVIDAEVIARNINEELENARKQEINTINAYHDKLSASRLLDRRNKASCSNTLPTNSDTGINKENETGGTQLSEEFDRLLKSESLRADNCAIQHNELLKFVNLNCGIKVYK